MEGVRLDRPYKHGPAWLRWNGTSKEFELIPDRASLVREVFAKAEEGWSLDRIAQGLNTSAVPTWDRGKRKAKFWRGARLRKMLLNRAAVGTLVMGKSEHDAETRKRSDKVLGTVENYFPPVVERDVFDRVDARLNSTAPRGRNAVRPVSSLVAGVAKCSHCGGSVIRVSKGEYVYLICSRAHSKAGCKYQAVSYREVEQGLRLNVEALIQEAPRGSSTEEIEHQIAMRDAGLSELRDEAQALLREFRETRSPTMRAALAEAERNIELNERQLQELRDRRERLGAPFIIRRLNTLREELMRQGFDVAAANRAVKAAVGKVVVDPEGGRINVHWRDSDAVSEVPIWSRHSTVFSDEGTEATSAGS
jgi:hypothetical protein